jgi:hypothetical protein
MSKKKEYTIRMPFTGVITNVIEAETKEEAIKKFRDELDTVIPDSPNGYMVDEWELSEKIVTGNVFWGVQNEMEIQEEEIED